MRKEEEMSTDRREGAMRIFEALSSVDEELLERSEAKEKVIPFWRYSKVLAACVCFLMLGIATYTGSVFLKGGNVSSDCAAPEEAGMAMDVSYNELAADGAAPAEEAEYVAAGPSADDVVIPETQLEDKTTAGTSQEKDALGNAEMAEQEANVEEYKDAIWDQAVMEAVSEQLDEEEVRAVEGLGEYLPAYLPEGYVFENGSGYKEEAQPRKVTATWYKGMDYITITVVETVEQEELATRLVDVSKPEHYDVHLYEIPYADSVPEGIRMVFDHPIFAEKDFSKDIIAARMKRVGEQGDTDTLRGNFAVLYDSGVLVTFTGRGDIEDIWELFQSIGAK